MPKQIIQNNTKYLLITQKPKGAASNTATEMKKTPTEKLFYRYKHLSKEYAKKINLNPNSPIQREDLIQEFDIKIFTSINSYINKLADARISGTKLKIVPIEYYIRTSLINKSRDIIKDISTSPYKFGERLSFGTDDIDVGVYTDYTEFNLKNNNFVVNDVDLTDGLENLDKHVYQLFLLGHNQFELCRKFKGKVNVLGLIQSQKMKLKSMKNVLIPTKNTKYQVNNAIIAE